MIGSLLGPGGYGNLFLRLDVERKKRNANATTNVAKARFAYEMERKVIAALD